MKLPRLTLSQAPMMTQRRCRITRNCWRRAALNFSETFCSTNLSRWLARAKIHLTSYCTSWLLSRLRLKLSYPSGATVGFWGRLHRASLTIFFLLSSTILVLCDVLTDQFDRLPLNQSHFYFFLLSICHRFHHGVLGFWGFWGFGAR